MSTTASSQRKRTDWDELADRILPALQEHGGLTAELKKQYGIGYVYRLQMALARKGWDLHGQALELKPITAKRPDVIAKQIAGRRQKGIPFWQLEVESGLTHHQMRRLVSEHGYELSNDTAASNGN